MVEGSSGGIRLKPDGDSTSTATGSVLSPEQFPDLAFVDATPDVNVPEGSEGRTGKQGAQTKGEASDGKKPRNLVVCIDGTANQFGLKNTNVVELYSRLVADETQLTYYDSGIGTYVAESNPFVRAKQWVDNALDMAFAIHHERITLSAYQWLSENYIRGDRIYLFGFSRGAYQVRIIAGMTKIVGLLRKGNNNQIKFAYQLYLAMMKVEQRSDGTAERPDAANGDQRGEGKTKRPDQAKVTQPKPTDSNDTAKICAQFKRTLCHKDLVIHFVGVWDTVSSIGATRGLSFPETTNGMLHVRTFRHALSLHELRGKFLPEYGNGGAGPIEGHGDVKEVWFAGSHSDIGGGNIDNIDLEHFGPSLRWMLYEALEHGLRVEPYQGGWSPPTHQPSMSLVWLILELLPLKRLAYIGKDVTERWPPHLCAGRMLQKGQLVHESAVECLKKEADEQQAKCDPPKVSTTSGLLWVVRFTLLSILFMVIGTPSAAVYALPDIFTIFVDFMLAACPFLRTISVSSGVATSTRARLLYEGSWVPIVEHWNMLVVEQDSHAKTVGDAIAALKCDVDKESQTISKALADTFEVLLSSESSRQPFIDALDNAEHSDRLLNALERSSQSIDDSKSHAYLQRVLMTLCKVLAAFHSRPKGCDARPSLHHCLRFADSETRAQVMRMFGTITGHIGYINSVAYSPNGACIASGSNERTIRLWDAATGQTIGEPLQGHEGYVLSVAFSPDGKRIVSGSSDNTIRLWDTETHQAVGPPLTGHEGPVLSVTFSPDGKLIASGSYDTTIRIWDAETRHAVGEPLRGHTDWVRSVAFSPDGRRIASGSWDWTVRIWDLETRAMVRVLQGHSFSVWSVVFSPDGRRIVSGSSDDTIRVWDAESGETVLGPLRGHSDSVRAVAVSPDGRYIASGSDDETVRLWDAQTGEAVGEPLRGHTRNVSSVAFSPDSRRVVSGSIDETLMIWDVDV